MERQLIVFRLANAHYGIDVAVVENIVKMQKMAALPHSPNFLEGITSLRGAEFPILDLRTRFGLPTAETTCRTRIIVVELNGATLGLIVDAVTEVLRICNDFIEPAPRLTALDSDFITGIAKVYDRSVNLLDLGSVLTAHEQGELTILPTATSINRVNGSGVEQLHSR